ncbi:hypothetical protein Taro_035871, partial [Colocasia esculenta]|nr:hypothetical protein [Colocasia esculenta]
EDVAQLLTLITFQSTEDLLSPGPLRGVGKEEILREGGASSVGEVEEEKQGLGFVIAPFPGSVVVAAKGDSEQLKADDKVQCPDSLATRDLSAGDFSSHNVMVDQNFDTGNIEEAEYSLREGGCLNYELPPLGNLGLLIKLT